MRQPERRPLRDLAAASEASSHRFVSQRADCVMLSRLAATSPFMASPDSFLDKTVLISCQQQLPAVLSLLLLDGVAQRILLCPPDLSPTHLPAVIAEAQVDIIVCDGTGPAASSAQAQPIDGVMVIPLGLDLMPVATPPHRHCATEWLLFTSGTTGRPKIVVHTLASLTGPLDDGLAVNAGAIWSTFYDIRRYGGLQILLRALLGGGSMLLSHAAEPVADFLDRVGQSGVTHISGTPSHWRQALMSPAIKRIDPKYVRLSGEVADQAILNRLAIEFPRADIAHAFASTEAGVAFDVRDGMAGFPAEWVGQLAGKADLRIQNGSLHIRSARVASRYLGDNNRLADAQGFVDTGDMIELRGDRYHFIGRREGIINVGGQKVHPEEVEAIINHHPAVQIARVRSRRSPITGAIVVADIVRRQNADMRSFDEIKQEILETCRCSLPAYKVPAMLYEVASIEVSASGKLVRQHA